MNYSNSQRAGVILYLTAFIFGAYLLYWKRGTRAYLRAYRKKNSRYLSDEKLISQRGRDRPVKECFYKRNGFRRRRHCGNAVKLAAFMELRETLFAGWGKAVFAFPQAVNGVFHNSIANYAHFHDAASDDLFI